MSGTQYEIDATTEESGTSVATCKQAPALRFDSSAQQRLDLFGPAELLATAFAACMLKNVERFSKTLSFDYDGARVHVVALRSERPPRIVGLRYLLRLSTNESEQRIDLLRRNLIRFGTVYNTLAAACEVSGEVVRAAPAGSTEGPGRSTPPTGDAGPAGVDADEQ